jgi:superfamily II DNA or RNA helicase
MFTFYKRSGIIIPRKYENEPFYFHIRDHLKRVMKQYQTGDYVHYYFYLESKDALLIPRFFPLEKYVQNYQIIDKTPEGEDIDIVHNITPRNEVQRRTIEKLANNNNCILQLPPGVGKTVIMIHTIGEIKKKSFILVHRDALAKQWRGFKDVDPPKGILSFTNLNEDNIAFLRSNSFEEDLKKPIIICTDQTFTSLLKRNRMQFLTSLVQANIGIFIADEVHTSVGAPSFSECSLHIPAKYVYGLSATPYRYDGNGDIIEYHLGDIIEDEDSEGTMEPKIITILADFQIDQPRRYKYLYYGGVFQRARYLNIMKNSKIFMSTIKGLIEKLKKQNRNQLIICERIDKMINILYDWVVSDSKAKFIQSANLDVLNNKIVFATPGKMRDGVDAPHIDALIMTSPVSNIEQMIGRVVRSKKGKKQPIVIDIVDMGCKHIKRSYFNRHKFYQNKQWNVRYLMYSNNKFSELDQETTMYLLEED